MNKKHGFLDLILRIFNAASLVDRVRRFIYTPQEQEYPTIYCVSRPNKDNIPDHWSCVDFAPAGIPTICVRAHAQGPVRAKISYFLGFKARPREYNTPQIRALQRTGFEIDFISLPDPGKQIGYLHDYKAVVKDFVMGNRPEGGTTEMVPHYIAGHSLGARAIIANKSDHDAREHMAADFAGCILVSPHIRSPFRSQPITNILYSLYCKRFHDVSFPNAPLDSLFKGNGDEKNSPFATRENAITHGQILYSNYETSDLLHQVDDGKIFDSHYIPTLMIASSKDYVSCATTIRKMAIALNAQYVESENAGHNPFIECTVTREETKIFIANTAEQWYRIHVPDKFAFIDKDQITYDQFEDPMVGVDVYV